MTTHWAPHISDPDPYDIDDLVRICKSGWKGIAQLGYDLNFIVKECLCGDSLEVVRIYNGFTEIHETIIRNFRGKDGFSAEHGAEGLLDLCAAPDNKWSAGYIYFPDARTEMGEFRNTAKAERILKKVTVAFATSHTLGEAIYKIVTPKNLERLSDYCPFPQYVLSAPISRRCSTAMGFLRKGFADTAREEAWWSCVWYFLEAQIEEMLDSKRRINADVPLTHKQFVEILCLLMHGHPWLQAVQEEDRRHTYQIVLTTNTDAFDWLSPRATAGAMLIQPAFVLAQQLQTKCSTPRFAVECRAPSCSNSFYTTRAAQKACARSQRGRRSPCKAEWDSYRKWLQTSGSDPEKVWNKPELKKQFLGVYCPRGSQTSH